MLDPETLSKSGNQDIVVTARDSLRYSFDGCNYVVTTDSGGLRYLAGSAKRYHFSSSQFASFHGMISFKDIERITTSERTPVFYAVVVSASLFLSLWVWLVVSSVGDALGW